MTRHFTSGCLRGILCSAMILFSLKSFSQEKETINISADDVNKFGEIFEKLIIYPVYEKTVVDYTYKDELSKLEQQYEKFKEKPVRSSPNKNIIYKSSRSGGMGTKEYLEDMEIISVKKETISKIISHIDKYISSNDNKNKVNHLIEAQSLADDIKLKILINEDVKEKHSKYTNTISKTIRLIDEKNKANDKYVQVYKDELNKIKFKEPKKPKQILIKEKIDSLSKITTEKVTYFIEDKTIDNTDLIGEFEFLSEKKLVCRDFKYYFSNLELADGDISMLLGCELGRNSKYPLIQNVKTNKMYFVVGSSFFEKMKIYKRESQIIALVNKLGYKEYKDKSSGYIYIKSKTAEIQLGEGIYKTLLSNKNFITEFDNDQIKIASLVKQSVSHSKTLDKYIAQYRIQRNRISTADINAWRTATNNAIKLDNQIWKLKDKYEYNYSFKLFDKSTAYEDLVDNIYASKMILGM